MLGAVKKFAEVLDNLGHCEFILPAQSVSCHFSLKVSQRMHVALWRKWHNSL
jgi:hypothetical protein